MNLCSFFPTLHLRSFALLLFCAVAGATLNGQEAGVKFYDNTYVDNIKAVRFHINGFPHSYPLIELGGGARLRLSFDDTSDEVVRYSYKFIHCDQDWQPSSLSPLEFNSGFTVDYLQDFDFSLRTLKNYVHYDLVFPNRNMKLEASGNYLLVVYNAEDEEFPVITRRFMVQESLAGVSGRVTRAVDVSKIHTHQEVDLTVNVEQMRLRAPLQELSATIIQNYRWDNAVVDIEPNLLGRGTVRFDYQGKVMFPGHNEYRNLDIRSVRTPRTPMVSITNEGDVYGMMMQAEPVRGLGTYVQYVDLNGDFVNLRSDQNQININPEVLSDQFQRFNLDFTGEYIEMTFVLDTNGELDEDVYIFGGLSEYQLKPNLRMVWNPNIGAYVGRTQLKQGFYNYHYVQGTPTQKTPARPHPQLNYGMTEGNFEETENNYLGLVYWRPLGGRYDRLVGAAILNSNIN